MILCRRARFRRLTWLAACAAGGAFAGIVGSTTTGNDYWYLAIPLIIAIGWLFVADPEACLPQERERGRTPRGDAP